MKLKRLTELTEKDEKQEREFVMMCLAVTCGAGVLAEALRLLLAIIDWSNGTLTDGWMLAARGINLAVCAVCAGLAFLIMREVKHRRVFTRLNALYITFIGCAATFGGIAQNAIVAFVYEDIVLQTGDMAYLIIGLLLLFIATLFNIGIRMKEEQELTV